MKTTTYLLIALLAISCTGKQQKTAAEGIDDLRFDSIVVEEKIQMPLIPEEPDYIPYATFNVKFVFPISFGTEEQLQKLQAIFYEKVLGEEYADAASPQEAMEGYKKNFPEWAQAFGMPIHYYNRELANWIVFVNKNVLNFCVFSRDEESSQPRASFGEYNYCIDLQTLKLLTLDDLLIGDYKIDLIGIIKKNIIILMKSVFSGPNLEEVLDDIDNYWGDCEVCELDVAFKNYVLTETGITFNYTDREIAALPGDYQVHVYYGEIADLLNPDMFAKLFPDIDLQKEKETFQQQEAENSKTVADMFMLLPDEAFDGEYSYVERERMIKEEKEEFGWNNSPVWLDLSDIESGKLKLEDDGDLPLGFVYFWRLQDNRRLVTVLNNHSHKLKAYWYINSKLEKDDDFYAFVNENSNIDVEDLFDLQNVPEDIRKDVQYFTDSDLSLSKDGIITFTISNGHFYDYPNREVFDALEYYIKFERIGDKWTKKRIKS